MDRLEEAFKISEKAYFSSEFGYSPVNHGNQTSMQSAYLFNYTKRPWLTQKWARSIQEKYYGTGVRSAYPGDEDQGQMSSWYVMSTLGLFQMNGGCDPDPVFELGSPRFQKATVLLSNKYYAGNELVIEAKNASALNCYIQSVKFNGKRISSPFLRWSQLKAGGKLELVMGNKENKHLFE